jgi:predicted ribosomally synthesized peptide with SipW-like signal peptide
MKTIIGLSIVGVLLLALVVGVTFAYFSSIATSTGNTFQAGTLNLLSVISGTAVKTSVVVTQQGHGLNNKVEFGLTDPIKPGSSGAITWTLSDNGTLPGILTILAITTYGQTAAPNEPSLAADPTNLIGLGQRMTVWVTRGSTDILGTTGAYVPISGLAAALSAESQPIVANGSLVYVLHWQVPTTVGNEIQGDTANLDITFTLTQVTS